MPTINLGSTAASLGGAFGTGLGSGISRALESLAEQKANDIQRKKYSTGLQSLIPSMSQESAQNIAQLPEPLIREFIKSKLNPSQPLANINIGGKSLKDITKSAASSREGLKHIQELRELNKSGKLGSWFGDAKSNKSFQGNVDALESFSKNNPLVRKLSKRLTIGDSKEAIDAQLDEIEKEFKKQAYQEQALQDILQMTGGQIPQDLEQAIEERTNQLIEQEQQPQQMQQQGSQDNGLLSQLGDLPRAGAGILAKGVQGLGEGITGLAAAPFSLANLASGGRIPVPEIVKSIQGAPEAIVKGLTGNLTDAKSDTEQLVGDTVADIASFLSPAGLLGLAGKGANLLGKGSKWLNVAAKALNIPLKTAAGTAALSNTAKFLTKKVGGSEGAQNVAKIGTMLAIPILGSRFMGAQTQKLSQEAAKAGSGINTTSVDIANDINNIYNKVSKLPDSKAKQTILQELEKNQGVQFSADKLIGLKDTLTQYASDLGKSFKGIIANTGNKIDKALNTVAASGKNPEFTKAFERYNDLSNALKQSNKVADFVRKNVIGGIVRNPWVTLGFRFLNIPKYKTLGLVGGGALGIGELERLGQMIFKSPEFRNAAQAFLSASAQGNIKAANQASRRLEKISEKK